MFYFAYLLGALVLGQAVAPFEVDFWVEPANWLTILSPLALGCLLCAIACSVIGYFGVRLAWRWHVVRHLERRRARRQAAYIQGCVLRRGAHFGLQSTSAGSWDTANRRDTGRRFTWWPLIRSSTPLRKCTVSTM
jgi:hypothetical protein